VATVRQDLVRRDFGSRPGVGRGTGRAGTHHPRLWFSFDSEDGLKTIVAKAAAGDAIWFMATINRIAEILAARGDTNPIGTRRVRAIGILARPAEARLLIEHQQDSAEPADSGATSEQQAASESDADAMAREAPCQPESDAEPDDHQSLSMKVPPRWDATAARPRVVLHFHLAEAALRAGHALVRPQNGGPLTLDELVEFLAAPDVRSGFSQCWIRPK
jgi:hypothetical protein